MKKTMILLALTVLCAALVLTGCEETPSPKTNTEYVIDVRSEGEKVICTQTTTYKNTVADRLEEVAFVVAPFAYTKDAQKKAYVGELPRYAEVTFSVVEVNGAATEPTFSETTMTLPVSLDRGESATFSFGYELVLPECALRFGQKDGYTNLSEFYPQVAIFENGEFRKDAFSTVGDPVVSDVADFDFSLNVPDSVVAAVPFSATETVEEGRKIIKCSQKSVRDLAVVWAEGYNVFSAEKGGKEVKYYTKNADAQGSADLASDALATFSESFYEYPYETFVLAETAFEADGMEYSGLVMIATDASDKERAIVHETAHQWFYNIVGSDNVRSPFIDEGLTTFITEFYHLLKGNEEKFEEGIDGIRKAYARYERLQNMRGEKKDLDMTKPIYDYTEYRYGMLVYDRAALLFDALYRVGGKDKFVKAVKSYCKNNYFGRVGIEEVKSAFSSGLKSDVGGLVDGFLTEGAVVTTFAA